MAMGYVTPFFGLSQKLGAVWKLPLKLISTLCATSRALSPTWLMLRRLEASTQADQHALRNIAGVEPDLVDARAVHVEAESRQAHHLLHVHVGGSGNLAHLVGNFLPEDVVPLHVRSHNLNVDGRG